MLLITRRPDEAIVINGSITVKIVEIRAGRVKLGFEFPEGNTVYREELFTKIQAENRAAAVGTAHARPLADVLRTLPSSTTLTLESRPMSQTASQPTEMTPMSSNVAAMVADTADELVFSTRFGEVRLRKDKLVSFPQGLFGFRECTSFGLSRLPNVDDSPILLLQCVNEPSVAFLVADPLTLGLKIDAADMDEALRETKMPKGDTQFLSILTLYDNGDSYYLTANLKAPVLVDSTGRSGVQFILSSKAYTTQHKI